MAGIYAKTQVVANAHRVGEVLLMSGFFYIALPFAYPFPFSSLPLAIGSIAILCYIFSVYYLNSYCDYAIDVNNKRLEHLSSIRRLQYLFFTLACWSFCFVTFWCVNKIALGCFLFSFSLWILYYARPFRFKSKLFLGSIIHFICGILHFHMCYTLVGAVSMRSVTVSIFIALLLTIGHLNHERLDFVSDMKNNIATTTVRMGEQFTKSAVKFLSGFTIVFWAVLYFSGIISLSEFSCFLLPLLLFVALQWNKAIFENTTVFKNYYRILFFIGGVLLLISKMLQAI